MKNVQGSGVPGQSSDLSTPSTSISDAGTHAMLERIEVQIRALSVRMAAIERRIAEIGGERASIPPTYTTPRAPRIPPFAMRNDGRVLLSVAHLAGCDLSNHERWEGVVLKEDEACGARDHLSDLFDDAAGRTAGRVLWKHKNSEAEPEGGSGKE